MAKQQLPQGRVTDVTLRLMKHLEANAGKVVYADDMAREFGLYKDTVQNGIGNLKRKPGWEDLETVIRGNAWRYNGPAGEVKADGQAQDVAGLMFTSLASTREGDLILQCEDGRIFRAKEL